MTIGTVIFIVIAIIIMNMFRSLNSNTGGKEERRDIDSEEGEREQPRFFSASSNILESWMAAAGVLDLEFVRQTRKNQELMIRGTYQQYDVMIHTRKETPTEPPVIYQLNLRESKVFPDSAEVHDWLHKNKDTPPVALFLKIAADFSVSEKGLIAETTEICPDADIIRQMAYIANMVQNIQPAKKDTKDTEDIPAPVRELAVEPEPDFSAEGIAAALFSASFPGQKEKELFEKIYAGKAVEFTGRLISVFEYSSDFVFKNGRGIKGTFQIAELKGKYGKQAIKAVASFPPDTASKLKGMNGKAFCFRGTLLKFEGFSKELYMEKTELFSK